MTDQTLTLSKQYVRIVDVLHDDANEGPRVVFHCYDCEDIGLVSFTDSINVPHACFVASSGRADAYGQMCARLADVGVDAMHIGDLFESSED